MPEMYDFGKMYIAGVESKQKDEEFKASLAQKEREAQAEAAFRELQMEHMNAQLREQTRYNEATLKNQYTDTALRRKAAIATQYSKIDLSKVDPELLKRIGASPFTSQQLEKMWELAPGELPSGVYLDNDIYASVRAEIAKKEDNTVSKVLGDLQTNFDTIPQPQSKIIETKEHVVSPAGDTWNSLSQAALNIIGVLSNSSDTNEQLERVYNERKSKPGDDYIVTKTMVDDPQEIKRYLNQTAPAVSKMYNVKAEEFGRFAGSVSQFADVASRLISTDNAGNRYFDDAGLTSEARNRAITSLRYLHTQNYLAESAQLKNAYDEQLKGISDKSARDELSQEYSLKMIELERKYFLKNQSLGQLPGQRYTK